ncbi:hypothetical protein CONPUDRAFT_160873 [Coniophora puteana RWD-64-598 SS2]|uniref:Phosducin domain-containing protein n=1 Tax=Coniophora puteana (strain RWD-64-598) TaxID=741705 RepID=A0A5M3N3G3_CONPW|nr:uncharacterized protein CONPUDRAFT_160873 [Coniophora puteana RWD-64-598 SS2]EIW85959.1 hypothetical protein CONPUDRAFT_160873 [Coniophora puteana RWD-64-598 SS2]
MSFLLPGQGYFKDTALGDDADIEHLVLSGKLFGGGGSRSSSPARSESTDISFASDISDDDELFPPLAQSNGGSSAAAAAEPAQESIGMGPGRTGVKGVIRDRREAASREARRRAKEAEAVRRRMERASLGGKTFLEEERERIAMEAALEGGGNGKGVDPVGRPSEGRFGHLREVGRAGFVGAVEKEERGVWVVVHLYDSSLDRCYKLDDTLARLARQYPQTKFLHARAAALGFASTRSSGQPARTGLSVSRVSKMPGRFDDDDEDPYDDGQADEKYYSDDEEEEEDVDTDMLPTMLVYRDGELVHNWVRVDWEAGDAGVEDLLSRRHIIATGTGRSYGGLGSDEEDELDWSDSGDLLE